VTAQWGADVDATVPATPTPAEALRLLLDGNERFVAGERLHPNQDADRRYQVEAGQRPFAVLFGCSDSRLAAEIIFDRGLGDLFVVRTAGHVVGPEVLGSIEYGVSVLQTPLVAVLGHDSCGAIAATLAARDDGATPAGYMRDIVERVMPSVLAADHEGHSDPGLVMAEHVRYSVDLLVNRSSVIAEKVAEGACGVVGLSYQLSEGSVKIISSLGV
jgi:carbonic anhydrase